MLPKAPAKRSQHVNATYRNIVGRNMLRAFGYPFAMRCDMSGVAGSNLGPTLLRNVTLQSFGRGLRMLRWKYGAFLHRVMCGTFWQCFCLDDELVSLDSGK